MVRRPIPSVVEPAPSVLSAKSSTQSFGVGDDALDVDSDTDAVLIDNVLPSAPSGSAQEPPSGPAQGYASLPPHWAFRRLRKYSRKVASRVSDSLSLSEVLRQLSNGLSLKFVLIMGLTGAGKSTLIRLLTGHQVFISHSISSGTRTFSMYPLTLDGTHYVLVDTPGFNDGKKSDFEVLQIILCWFSSMTPYVDLSSILYCHDITQARLGGSGELNLRLLEALSGPEFFPNVGLVTTKWSSVRGRKRQEKLAREREQQLVEGSWKRMVNGGAQVFRMKGTDIDLDADPDGEDSELDVDEEQELKEAVEEVENILRGLQEVPKRTPSIQKELREKVPIEETAAARVLAGEKEKSAKGGRSTRSEEDILNELLEEDKGGNSNEGRESNVVPGGSGSEEPREMRKAMFNDSASEEEETSPGNGDGSSLGQSSGALLLRGKRPMVRVARNAPPPPPPPSRPKALPEPEKNWWDTLIRAILSFFRIRR